MDWVPLSEKKTMGIKSDSIIQLSEKRWVHVHYKANERQNQNLVVSKLCCTLESPGDIKNIVNQDQLHTN